MDVSIIIVNFNTQDLILQCLKSIFKQTKGVDFEVIVVDNASSDRSLVAISEKFPQVKILKSCENVGFGRANNLAINSAKGKYLFLLNSDTILINNAIKIFFDFAEFNKTLKIGVLGTVLQYKNNEVTHSSGSFPSKWEIIKVTLADYVSKRNQDKFRQKELCLYKMLDTPIEVDYITGADLFVSASIMKEFKGFDPMFFMYYEDSELQFRMQKQGFKRIIINGPKIIHFEGASNINTCFSIEKRMIVLRSMFYYFKKHSHYYTYCLFRLFYFLIRLPSLFNIRISLADRLRYFHILVME